MHLLQSCGNERRAGRGKRVSTVLHYLGSNPFFLSCQMMMHAKGSTAEDPASTKTANDVCLKDGNGWRLEYIIVVYLNAIFQEDITLLDVKFPAL